MKKKQLRRDIRLGSMILCIVIIGALTIISCVKYKYPGFNEEKVALYRYESQGKVNYDVFLNPNSLYDKRSLGEDQVYLSNLVDSIDTTYSYSFTGEREAEIKGYYEILAVIEGYSGEGDERTTLWKKEIPLFAKTSFEATDKKFSVTKKIPLKLANFNDFAKKVSEEIKVNTQAKITTLMNVELSAKTDKGVIEKKSTSSIEVPLAGSYFKIIKKQSETKPEVLEDVKQVQRSIDMKLLTLLGTGIGISVVALLILLFGTQSVKVDILTKKLKQIFKKHGTRLVALNSEIAATSEHQSKVHSMEDLVRISDELGKPIIYKHSYDYKENSKFWVIDEARFYIFELEVAGAKGPSLKDRVKTNGAKERETGDGVFLGDDNRTTQEESKNDFSIVSESKRKNDKHPKVGTWANL
ncbi:MAG: hypothetical protein H6Q63_515 [Firmicutes bacterium]|nr:hypothetical protein [Bacillota bacterium]